MKISLVHGKYFNSWEALGLGYIGAYLKSHVEGVEVDFYQGCFDSDETVIAGCADSDIVAFSCTTPTFPYAVRVARLIKELNPAVRTVVGGYHPSAAPEASLVTGIDQVITGEGETAMVEIAGGNRERILYGRPLEFSEIPWPDRELIKNERNIQVAYNDNKKRITSFQSHRGCAFMCKYCADGFIKVLYENGKTAPVRHRSVSDLLDEMEAVTERYSLDLLKFSDPTWNLSVEWVTEFCREKIKRGFAKPFYPNIHAGVATGEMFRLMAEAGCYEVAIGVESGSPKILKQIGKGTTVDSIRRSVEWAKAAGILVRGYFLVGMPDETEEDLLMTERFAEVLELDEFGVSLLCPYPGTEMYDAVKYADVDWAEADEYSNDFWETEHFTNSELKERQRLLTEKFKERLTWHNKVISEGDGVA
ncbi:MAG: radical SAM protein [Thermodesulfobacteriota bacterium]